MNEAEGSEMLAEADHQVQLVNDEGTVTPVGFHQVQRWTLDSRSNMASSSDQLESLQSFGGAQPMA